MRRRTKKRLLSGLIKCGLCSGGMTISRGDRYYCSARREKGTCDTNRGIHATELEDRVLNGLRDILIGNEDLLETFTAEFKQELARLRKERRGDGERFQREQNEVERGIARCLEFITSGDASPGLVRDQLRDLETRKRDLDAAIRAAPAAHVVEIHQNYPDLYRRKVGELAKLLEDESSRPRAMEIIRALVERIEVYPGEARGQCEVMLTGALAEILAFFQKNTTAASDRDGGTFLMVAGARSLPLRTPVSTFVPISENIR